MLIIVEWNEDGIEPGLNLNQAPILFYFILLYFGGKTLELKILQIQNKNIPRTALKISDKKNPTKKSFQN
jgi:hypothetical protein